MTLAELRQIIATYDHMSDDIEVYLQEDPEGNGHHRLYRSYEAMVVDHNGRDVDTYVTPEEAAANPDYYDEGDLAPEEAVRAIILRP